MRAVVVANGHISDYDYYKDIMSGADFVICADGAIVHCIALDRLPDLWIGDFDSCNQVNLLSQYPQLKGIKRITLDTHKDVTDTHAACDIAIEQGYANITIIGAIGTRFDHTISNIHLLEYLHAKGVRACIENEYNTITVFDKELKLTKKRKYLSLIPLDSEVVVKNTSGLLYPLENFILPRNISRGVSNEIIGDSAVVTLEKGVMLAIESND